MQVARLAPLNLNKWGGVIQAITSALEEIKAAKLTSHSVTFLDTQFKPSPYLQASLDPQGNLVIELVSNEYLQTKLTKWQESQVRLLGFKMPHSENPNYSRVVNANEQTVFTARHLLDAARTIFEVRDDGFFTFGSTGYEIALAETDAFWHHYKNRTFLCLPGMNPESTVEGLNATDG
jgi:hypothetical protein